MDADDSCGAGPKTVHQNGRPPQIQDAPSTGCSGYGSRERALLHFATSPKDGAQTAGLSSSAQTRAGLPARDGARISERKPTFRSFADCSTPWSFFSGGIGGAGLASGWSSVLRHSEPGMHIARPRYGFRKHCRNSLVALYWPQPLVWLAAFRLMKSACEQACDDGVLSQGTKTPRAYAGHLNGNRARALNPNGPNAALEGGIAMTRTNQLEGAHFSSSQLQT